MDVLKKERRELVEKEHPWDSDRLRLEEMAGQAINNFPQDVTGKIPLKYPVYHFAFYVF